MAERRKLGRPSFSPTRKEAFRKDSNMSKKMFRDKKRQKRDEALSTVVPPTATRYKHIRVTTATFWRWRSLAQELGLDGDEQMASFLLNTYYERAVEAASQEQRQDIPPNSEESRQIVETSMFPDDEQGTETDAIGSTSTTLPMQATQDGSIGLLLTEPPPDSMKEQVEDDWRGGDGDKTNDGGEMVLEGKFTCLIKTEPHESGEESNEQEALPSVSQQGDSLAGDDRKEIEEVEFKCLIKEEPDDGEHNQPSCSQQGGNSSKQSSCQEIGNTQIISGDTSHDRSHGRHLPGDHPLQGTLSHSSPRGNCSSGNVGKHSSCQQKANTQIISGDSSHDRSHGKHLPGDYPLQGAPSHSSPRGNRSSWDSRKQSSYQREAQEISHDRSHERPPQDFPIPAVLGNHSDLSTRGNYSSGDSRGQRSHHKESALIISGDPSVDTSHDGPRGEHLPEDFPIQTILGNLAGLSARGSYSGEYDSHLLPNQGNYATDSATMSDDHEEERLNLKTDNAMGLGEKCETAYSKQKSSQISSTRTNQSNPCINSAGEQLFTCSVCQKGYNRKHNLYRHMRLHSGDRPHECTYCKKRFWQSSELKGHLRIHTGQKPYSCSVCDRQFRFSSNLNKHMAVHLRKRRKYQCAFCDEGFSTRALRDAHIASAHPSGDSRGQRSHHKESALIISGDPSVDTSHDGPRGEHLPEDFPIQTILGNLAGLSARGSYSGGDSRGQRSHHKESALTMSGDPSGDTSHDRPRGEHLPEDFPIQTVLGNLAGLSARGSYSGEYDSHLLPNQGNYATDSATMSDDHEEERLNLKTDAIGLGEKCETASSKQKSSQISSTRTKQSNPCINSAGEQLFTCSVCQKGYNRKHNLYRHMRLHSGERPHECTYCKKRFWQSSELKRHLRIHTGQKPYSCSVCDKQFRFSSNLKKHMAVHLRKRRKYQCAFCDEGFSTRALRDAHSASAHPSGDSRGQSSHHKESALKMSGDPSGDTSHDGPRGEHLPEDFPIQTVLGNLAGLSTRGSFSSEYGAHLLPNQGDYSQWQSPTMSDDHKEGRLDLKTDNARELDEKSSNVSSTSTNQTNLCINQQLFTCSVCQKGYNRKHNLYRHMRLHSGERPHECTYCKKRFWQSSELKRHLRIHTGQKPYSCSVCDKQFRDTSNLKVHMAVHLRKKKKYQCSFCDEGFSTRALRDTHSASAHPSEKPFHCMECDMRFCRRGSLQVHIWRTHTARDKPHVCSFCNKAFSHLCFLTTHKRIHTGEKPYECTVCGDRFSFHTQLADHKAKHTGVKPYSCSICEKRFWRKSCLNRHQRTHTGKKPFQCPECKKGFAEKSTLIKHLNTHPNL
ncbi:zinc finger protein 845-like isoform X5 [Lytechinus variegatus]|uniref:zinc finger protein 845-like isoform X5 n=1 Tax=Lytechinus variegatus TaxID=7654 RepID=UPI001BB1B405|nr:zinc finger protein 845-like isoform X5 [Lytechinus variegatus]